jgi:hypothetical protein
MWRARSVPSWRKPSFRGIATLPRFADRKWISMRSRRVDLEADADERRGRFRREAAPAWLRRDPVPDLARAFADAIVEADAAEDFGLARIEHRRRPGPGRGRSAAVHAQELDLRVEGGRLVARPRDPGRMLAEARVDRGLQELRVVRIEAAQDEAVGSRCGTRGRGGGRTSERTG